MEATRTVILEDAYAIAIAKRAKRAETQRRYVARMNENGSNDKWRERKRELHREYLARIKKQREATITDYPKMISKLSSKDVSDSKSTTRKKKHADCQRKYMSAVKSNEAKLTVWREKRSQTQRRYRARQKLRK